MTASPSPLAHRAGVGTEGCCNPAACYSGPGCANASDRADWWIGGLVPPPIWIPSREWPKRVCTSKVTALKGLEAVQLTKLVFFASRRTVEFETSMNKPNMNLLFSIPSST